MYYDGANWQWEKGDEMNLRFIERDGKKILQQEVLEEYGSHWEDVPCVEEKKEQRKLWEVINDASPMSGHQGVSKHQSKAAISAVIECYSQWSKINSGPTLKPFPEYLKEKLGNE